MLLPLLTFIALLAGIVTVWSSKERSRLTQPAFPRRSFSRSFSLWSFVLFLFFPPAEMLWASKYKPSSRQRHNYSEI
ncbi:hypothetical protein [Chroococcidiopsis sp. CCNUC1]|uniref:hypothetical protein n=1 Tax=Chroococcidiopsis sp. CCNUC1 TaxID=2653189 RepID=UPI002021ACDE|nr:hypothetical protein [Chroococcidiopsis sp. CCNUC1]URD48016.1 hypothetical protein M5J74_16910 [Chroococcidiopsis sp. CCNUC1]